VVDPVAAAPLTEQVAQELLVKETLELRETETIA